MSKPTSEVKNRWSAKTYKRYTLLLRYDKDAELIEKLEEAKKGEGIAEYIRKLTEKG